MPAEDPRPHRVIHGHLIIRVVIAIDHLQVTSDSLETRIAAIPLDETVTIHAFRRDELMTFEAKLQISPSRVVRLSIQDKAKLLPWLSAD